jgi:hypothetical protein
MGWILLEPSPPGNHELHLVIVFDNPTRVRGGFATEVSYNLT